MKFRILCRATPGHVYCRVFVVTAQGGDLYESAFCGSLTVRQGVEFAALVKAFSGAEFEAEEAEFHLHEMLTERKGHVPDA